MKRCAKCGETKPLGDFNRQSSAKDGRISYCKLCHRVDSLNRWSREHTWRSQGIDEARARAALEEHEGFCALCGTDRPGGRGWVIDHCHATGNVRGVLCWLCNVGLGAFKDSSAVLRAAADYLDRSRA